MTISVGDTLPNTRVEFVGNAPGAATEVTELGEFAAGRKLVLFTVPGAFTPTCSEQHLPGYVEHIQAFKDKGVDVACVSVNDKFVMQAWAQSRNVPDGMRMIADGNGDLVKALGLDSDFSAYGMGTRGKRFALYAENGVVRALEVEAPGEMRVSSAENMLTHIS